MRLLMDRDVLELTRESHSEQVQQSSRAPAAASSPFPLIAHEAFQDQASRTPDAVAIVFQGQQVTYRELDAKSNQLAHLLRERGVGCDVRVGISLERSPELVIGLLAIGKAGGAYVPLEPSYPQERLQELADETCPLLLVTDSRLAAKSRIRGAGDTLHGRDAREHRLAIDGRAAGSGDRREPGGDHVFFGFHRQAQGDCSPAPVARSPLIARDLSTTRTIATCSKRRSTRACWATKLTCRSGPADA